VRTNTVSGPGGDAAVILLKGTPTGLALTSDVNPVYCYLDPATGGAQAIAEAVRNLACVGAEPVGLTDCLTGNPSPEIMWQFRECVRGMAEACRALGVPVVSGNVSLYNETEGRSIHPTPTVAMVGVVPDLGDMPASHFRRPGRRLVLLGTDRGEFGGSAYLRLLHGVEQGRPPRSTSTPRRLARLLRETVPWGSCAPRTTSPKAASPWRSPRRPSAPAWRRLSVPLAPRELFSESQARAIVAILPGQVERFLEAAERHGVPALEVGESGGERLVIEADGATIDAPVARLREIWATALPRALEL
jgi:phosphoribosylformylglycinamidine synthase